MPVHNPLPCSHSVMSYNGTKVVLLDTGNYPGQANYLNMTNTWNNTDWTLDTNQIDPLGPLPVRINHGMSYDGTKVVLFGGQGQSETVGVLSDTWSYSSGGTWSLIAATATSPFGRYNHEMAYLESVGTLMFGGCTVGNLLEETWLYTEASGWAQLYPATTPPARTNFAMAGSSASELVLMYGGQGTNETLGDSWMWVGGSTGNWVKQNPSVQPPFMTGCSMAYDAANTAFVMFGGNNGEGLGVPTTWVWTGGNGGNWTSYTMANGTGPASRVSCQLSYDGTGVVLFGGYGTASNVFSDTWRFSFASHTWTQL